MSTIAVPDKENNFRQTADFLSELEKYIDDMLPGSLFDIMMQRH